MNKVLMVDSLVGNEYANRLCQAIHDNGFDVTLVTVEGREMDESYNFPVLFNAPSKQPQGSKVSKAVKYGRYIVDLLRKSGLKDVDLIHFQFFRLVRVEPLVFRAMKAMGFKLAHTAHNIVPSEYSKIDYVLRGLVYRSADLLLVHSERTKRDLLAAFDNVDPDKIAIVPEGTADELLPKQAIPKAEARRSLGIEPDQKVLLFFGYIREYKGLDLLLEAFEIAARSTPDVTLVIAGKPHTDELDRRYRAMMAAMQAQDRVKYIPEFVANEDVARYFSAADAVALTYHEISHSGVIHVAHSFGKPVIATDVGDFNEAVEEAKSGFLARAGDRQHLADKIVEAFEDDQRLADMADYVAQVNSEKPTWHDVGQLTIDAYRSML